MVAKILKSCAYIFLDAMGKSELRSSWYKEMCISRSFVFQFYYEKGFCAQNNLTLDQVFWIGYEKDFEWTEKRYLTLVQAFLFRKEIDFSYHVIQLLKITKLSKSKNQSEIKYKWERGYILLHKFNETQ